ncbi:hypothetical protein [Microbacterium trichothecenolyticum]|uniref:Uncharacterized protein n=1 Tax=Microbacterium trichothecenolyticum TaxID=69370 RepID=A0ABU0TX98_MICTR|nr:hypothetical protein [Microbacterium trichothecenolyticum]MDQ1124281.1 hypothetical protein [Microbacterium trichothecenolyticum]
MDVSTGLLGVCIAVTAAVLAVAMPRVGTPAAMNLFLRFAAVGGVCAVGSSAMYLIFVAGAGITSLVMGDVAMVLAPAVLFVAIIVLSGGHALLPSVAAVVLAVGVAVVTATVPLPASSAVKTLALALACGATAWAAERAGAGSSGPLRLISVTTALFAAYCVVRVTVGFSAGWESPVFVAGFSFIPTTVLGGVGVMLIGAAVVRLRFGQVRDSAPEQCPVGSSVVLGDWDLASAAYGPDRMRALVTELRSAGRELNPDAVDIPRGIEVSVPDAYAKLGERLRSVYGWEPEQTILLVDGAGATAATPTVPPPRRRRRGSSRF